MNYLIGIVSLVVSIIALSKASQAEDRLNKYLGNKENSFSNQNNASYQPANPQDLQNSSYNSTVNQHVTASQDTDPFTKFFRWYGREWPLKTGALLIILSFVWFLSYAFLNNWIGPLGRITIGIVTGSLVMLLGNYYLFRAPTQGSILVALGSIIISLTIFAAQSIFQMFPPAMALIFFGMVIVVTSIISVVHKQQSLSILSLIIGGLVPLLIGSSEPSVFNLFSYLVVLVVGVISIAQFRKWEILAFIALIIVLLYSFPYFFDSFIYQSSADVILLQVFSLIFVTIFFFHTIASILVSKAVQKIVIFTAIGISILVMGWVTGLVPEEWRSIVTFSAAFIFTLTSYGVYLITRLPQPVYLYTGICSHIASDRHCI